MTKNTINVTASTGAPVKVNVVATNSQGEVTLSQDTSAYNAEIARQWAISDHKVLQEDYSSKYYAGKAKESETAAKNYATTVENVYSEIQNSANGVLKDIEEARIDAVDNIITAKDESIASVEAKSNEVLSTVNEGIAEINTTKTNAVNAVNNTKTTILQDIEFVADGEKQEIQDLADEIKDNGNTVNTAINAGIERLNSIDALKKSQITNCLLEVPQRIKLELNNGTLTLKAGSIVTVPNGKNTDGSLKFDYVTIENDLTYKPTWGNGYKNFAIITGNGKSPGMCREDYAFSGNTEPTIKGSGQIWYDTANNIIKRYNGTTWLTTNDSLFLAEMTGGSDGIASIDQVFNGMGYIGSTVWVDKGVKGLIPNGRNEDGTLKNIEYTHNRVEIASRNVTGNEPVIIGNSRSLTIGSQPYTESATPLPAKGSGYSVYLNTSENIFYVNNGSAWVASECFLVATASLISGVINNLDAKKPFRAVDYNDAVVKTDLSEVQTVVETYSSGSSWYRVWSDGWCEQGGHVTANGATVTFLKPFKDTNYTALLAAGYVNTATVFNWGIINKTTTTMVCSSADNNSTTTTRPCDWQASGYIK